MPKKLILIIAICASFVGSSIAQDLKSWFDFSPEETIRYNELKEHGCRANSPERCLRGNVKFPDG